jgi:hypothetical protein
MGKCWGADAVRDARSGMDRRSAAQSLHHRPFWTLAVSENLGAAYSGAACSSQQCVQRGDLVVASPSEVQPM